VIKVGLESNHCLRFCLALYYRWLEFLY